MNICPSVVANSGAEGVTINEAVKHLEKLIGGRS